MYNIPNMGMINSNSMINYTYLNTSYQNYHSNPQPGYNNFIGNNNGNKFTPNQFYPGTQTPTQPQIYPNMYQNKMPLNQPVQTAPLNTPIMNTIVNTNIANGNGINNNSNPSVLGQNTIQLNKEATFPSPATNTITPKKPINLDAQSFIPKNLKKTSISSEKEAYATNTKNDALDLIQIEAKSENIESPPKTSVHVTEDLSIQAITIKEGEVKAETETEDKSLVSNLQSEKDNKDSIHEDTNTKTNYVTDKKEVSSTQDQKLPTSTSNSSLNNSDSAKSKPKTLLGSILSQPQSATKLNVAKQSENTTISTSIPSAKKKQNDVNKAWEEKARVLKEQEKLKKEEKLKEEIKQKQSASLNTNSSNKKADKEARKVKKNESEVAEEENAKEEENENIYKEEEEPVQVEEKVEKKYSIERIYFKVYQNENSDEIKNRYSIDYLFSFRNWKICNETKLIEDLVEGHIKDMKETVEEISTQKHQGRGGDNKGGFGKRGTKFREEPAQPRVAESLPFQRSKIDLKPPEPKDNQSTETGEGLGKWGRKDLSKEEKLASEFKSKREEEVKKDPIRFKLTE